jgi:alkanesulfonate monooxygenase SsuD/methylene tetrahydromethanopterin reductase-like flavin-dependent oxidoreductase (luciferase family)
MKFTDKAKLFASQAINVLFFGGEPDESLSARAWRQRHTGWNERRDRIDKWFGAGHCLAVYTAQQARAKSREIVFQGDASMEYLPETNDMKDPYG